MVYRLSITIPNKVWKKIWEKHFPDGERMLAEYLFILKDTYGLGRSSINGIYNKIIKYQNNKDIILLEAPKERLKYDKG